ncbi:MAG: ribbon-helix-helix protein, CopG family [Acidobacteria bacterium]|nr:ribbon-helix-helix protein, CopG family [Acidobacteriota bacterium]
MKPITINVSEPVYRDFQRLAKAQDRTASQLIRQAMEDFRERQIARSTTLADLTPVSVGRVLKPLGRDDDLLAEMLEDDRA